MALSYFPFRWRHTWTSSKQAGNTGLVRSVRMMTQGRTDKEAQKHDEQWEVYAHNWNEVSTGNCAMLMEI